MKNPLLAIAGVVVLTLFSLADVGVQSGVAQTSVPPTPAPPIFTPTPEAATATPSPTPAPRGKRRQPSAASSATPAPAGSPTETPAPPQFTTLDGVWEIEIQTRGSTYYQHMLLRQSGAQGADVSGIWDRGGKDSKVPLTGTFDGRLFKLTATFGDKTYTFTGYVENYSDIVGMANDGSVDIPFTAQHRKREKLFQNISPGIPGG